MSALHHWEKNDYGEYTNPIQEDIHSINTVNDKMAVQRIGELIHQKLAGF